MRCNNRLCEYNSRYNNDGCNKLDYALSQEKCETKKRWRIKILLDADVRKGASSAGVLLAEDIKPYKKSYADEDDLMDEFCNRINCHSCDGIDPSGEPNGYGCKPMENFITKNDKLFECNFVDNSSK